VAQGRVLFQNIQKFVIYLVSCNLSEIFVVMIIGFVMPAATLLPLQILFLNMVTDVFPALALGLGKGDKTVMELQPKDPKNDIISNRKWVDIVLYALMITITVVAAVVYCQKNISTDDKVLNNVAFITLAFAQLFHVFNMSSPHAKLFLNDITKNLFVWLAVLLCAGLMVLVYVVPHINEVLDLADLTFDVWALCIVASLLPLLLGQVYKRVFER
jgi:Ca2+-transporting ATPase